MRVSRSRSASSSAEAAVNSGVMGRSGDGVGDATNGWASCGILMTLSTKGARGNAHGERGRSRHGSARLTSFSGRVVASGRSQLLRTDPTAHAFVRGPILTGLGNLPALIWFHKLVLPMG